MNLYYSLCTSNIGMCILWNIFQSRQYPVDDIICLKVRNNLCKFAICNASDLRLNIIEIFRVVRQKWLELFLTHRFRQLLNLRYQFIPYPPRKLIWNYVEVTLQCCWCLLSRQLNYCIYQIYFVRLLFVFGKELDYFEDGALCTPQPFNEIFGVLGCVFAFDYRRIFYEWEVVGDEFLLVRCRKKA